jgi:hypothetical protein
MPTQEEAQRLQMDMDRPVLTIKGLTRDGQHRTLHFIDKVTAAGRMQYGYRYGAVPE